MKPVEQKSHLYKTISTLNRAFAFVLHSFEALEESGIFRRKYMRMFKNKSRELQAQANEEILETLKQREEADWQHFGDLVRAFDRQYEDPTEVMSVARNPRKARKPVRKSGKPKGTNAS